MCVVLVHSLAPSKLRWPRCDKINLCSLLFASLLISWHSTWGGTVYGPYKDVAADSWLHNRGAEEQLGLASFLAYCSYGVWLFTVLTGRSVDVSDNGVSVASNWYLVSICFEGDFGWYFSASCFFHTTIFYLPKSEALQMIQTLAS